MRSTAKGLRLSDNEWMELEEIYRPLREKYRKLSFNDFIAIVVKLGNWAWLKLPTNMHQQLLNPHKVFTRREKIQMKIRSRLESAENFKIDSKLTLGLPFLTKEAIRREASVRKMRMSPYIRSKLGVSAIARERLRT